MAGHVWSDDAVRTAVYSWHVPLFFFLTGYLWTAGRTVRSEVGRRARSLLQPYLVWLGLIAVVWVPWSAAAGSSTMTDLVRLAVGGQHLVRPFSAFWFVTALFVCAVAFRALERFPTPVAWAVAVGGLVTTVIAPELVLLPPLSAGTAMPALVFVLVGRTARGLLPRVRRPVLTGTVLVAAAALAIALGVRPLDLKHADFGTPVLSVAVASAISAGAILVATATGPATGRRAGALVTALAASGIGVVLTHAVVIWALPGAPSTLVFITATAIPWMVAVIAARTPAAPWLLGTRNHRAASVPATASTRP